jgi:hypothetical protein
MSLPAFAEDFHLIETNQLSRTYGRLDEDTEMSFRDIEVGCVFERISPPSYSSASPSWPSSIHSVCPVRLQ